MNSRTLVYSSLTLALLFAFADNAAASITVFDSIDTTTNPFTPAPHPNSDATAANFNSAASSLGTIQTIDLESATQGNFSSLAIAPGLTASLIGTDVDGGIRTSPTYFSGLDPNRNGYNTTSGGQQFLAVVPTFGSAISRLTLSFSTPIQAFGTYLTGLGDNSGNLFVTFNDGTSQSLQFSGPVTDGSTKFIGFTDPGAQIAQVAFELHNIAANTRDNFALDDLRFVAAVPEPTTSSLTLLSIAVTLQFRRRSRP
jgi:hypothetical protein